MVNVPIDTDNTLCSFSPQPIPWQTDQVARLRSSRIGRATYQPAPRPAVKGFPSRSPWPRFAERSIHAPVANSTPASEALEASLSQQFWERLRVFGARRLGDAALAEDLAQEVLRLVTEALRSGRINDRDALPGFVFQTATHLCLHHYRSRSREERALARMAGMESGTSRPGPLDILVTDEARRQVRSALAELKSDERDLLRRIYFDEEPSEETARRLRVTPGALRVRKFRALEHLAALLGKARSRNAASPSGTLL